MMEVFKKNYVKINKMEFIESFCKEDWTERLAKTQHLKTKYPGRIPVIVDRGNKITPHLQNHKYLVPVEMTEIVNGVQITYPTTMGHLKAIIRKHMPELAPHQALFMFIHQVNIIPSTSASVAQVYDQYQGKDGFLILTCTLEHTFG